MNCKKLALSLSLALLSLTTAFAQTSYTYTTINYPGDTFTQLLGINNGGFIAGYHNFAANSGFTYEESSKTFTTENVTDSQQTQVIGINNQGFKTDGFFVSAAGVTEGFTYYQGVYTPVNFPGSAFNQLLSQNDHGQAAGYYSLSASGAPDTPYVYDEFGGIFEVINIPNSTNAQATGINNSSEVVGFFVDATGAMHGWLLNQGFFTQLDDPNGKGNTAALGLNNKGQIVGSYVDTAGNTHGFVYTVSSKTWQTIDDPNGVGNTIVNGINDLGDLVGFYGPQACGTNDCSGFIAKP